MHVALCSSSVCHARGSFWEELAIGQPVLSGAAVAGNFRKPATQVECWSDLFGMSRGSCQVSSFHAKEQVSESSVSI